MYPSHFHFPPGRCDLHRKVCFRRLYRSEGRNDTWVCDVYRGLCILRMQWSRLSIDSGIRGTYRRRCIHWMRRVDLRDRTRRCHVHRMSRVLQMFLSEVRHLTIQCDLHWSLGILRLSGIEDGVHRIGCGSHKVMILSERYVLRPDPSATCGILQHLGKSSLCFILLQIWFIHGRQ